MQNSNMHWERVVGWRDCGIEARRDREGGETEAAIAGLRRRHFHMISTIVTIVVLILAIAIIVVVAIAIVVVVAVVIIFDVAISIRSKSSPPSSF